MSLLLPQGILQSLTLNTGMELRSFSLVFFFFFSFLALVLQCQLKKKHTLKAFPNLKTEMNETLTIVLKVNTY